MRSLAVDEGVGRQLNLTGAKLMKRLRFRAGRTTAAASALALLFGGSGLAVVASTPAAAAEVSADTVTELPVKTYSRMLVDDTNRRVYITTGDKSPGQDHYLLVYDFDGNLLRTHGGPGSELAQPSGLALSADGTELYVATTYEVRVYDTATLDYKRYLIYDGAGQCDSEVALSGGRLWFTRVSNYDWRGCDQTYYRFRTWSPAENVQDGGETAFYGHQLATGEGLPDRMIVAQRGAPNGMVIAYDTAGGKLAFRYGRAFADADGQGALKLRDLAVSPDGGKVAVADAEAGVRLLNTADFSDAERGYDPLPEGASASAVAYSGDGALVARGATASGTTADLLVENADPTTDGAQRAYVFEDSAAGGDRVAPRGLGFSRDGSRLFAVTTNADGSGFWLHTLDRPAPLYDAAFDGALTTEPGQAVAGEPLTLRGTLRLGGPAPAEPARVTAVRTDTEGAHDPLTAQVAADGTFEFTDVPGRTGDATYTVSYAGDATHRPAESTSLTVSVTKASAALALTAPDRVRLHQGVHITGTLTAGGFALPAGTTVRVTRTDWFGARELAAAEVAADGTLRIDDTGLRALGTTTYEVTYEGDALHEGARAEVSVRVRLF
ncbi:Ig-like domain repeat protein [Streptomyces sp. NPDC020898]|uniref:Ig-like domain repeat protein n=1 Tax=Streptomyces sp. NPDC020898 TaxID=3365101 RepID=UPI00378842F6